MVFRIMVALKGVKQLSKSVMKKLNMRKYIFHEDKRDKNDDFMYGNNEIFV